jgi:aminoglycoside phosphotransferase (APT) family kinase protein
MLNDRIAETGGEIAERHPGPWVPRMLDASPEGRAVVEWRQGDRVLVAKLRPDGGGAAQLALLRQLYASATTTLRVPEPVTWLEASRALVTGSASGTSCRHADPLQDPAVFERIGRALAEFHGLALVPGPAKRLDDHIAELIKPAPRVLAAALPQYAAHITRALARLEQESAAWGLVPVVPLHRDFHLRQLFDDGVHVTVIDWDDAASGDPAFDVGYFTAYLRSHFTPEAAEAGIAAFRRGYGGNAALWDRVPVYERFNALRRACRRFRLQDNGWQRELEAMFARLAD